MYRGIVGRCGVVPVKAQARRDAVLSSVDPTEVTGLAAQRLRLPNVSSTASTVAPCGRSNVKLSCPTRPAFFGTICGTSRISVRFAQNENRLQNGFGGWF